MLIALLLSSSVGFVVHQIYFNQVIYTTYTTSSTAFFIEMSSLSFRNETLPRTTTTTTTTSTKTRRPVVLFAKHPETQRGGHKNYCDRDATTGGTSRNPSPFQLGTFFKVEGGGTARNSVNEDCYGCMVSGVFRDGSSLFAPYGYGNSFRWVTLNQVLFNSFRNNEAHLTTTPERQL